MPSPDAIRSAQAYWDLAANTYEQDFSGTLIGQTRRAAVRRDLTRIFHPGQRVLEINCGTGSDAVFLAQRGIRVLACDIAPRMIQLARERVAAASLDDSVSLRVLPTEELAALRNEPLFDGAFSNFSGLNCVEDLSAVASDLSRLLKPGSRVLLCVMGRFVPWEILWFLAHRDTKKAFRRFQSSSTFSLEGGPLTVRRPSVKELARIFGPAFRLRQWKGVGITVPPTFLEKWAGRFPRLVRSLAGLDQALEYIPGLRSMADCAVIELEHQHAFGAAV
jgi:ubiquinone/menaquinone biosynthesis C-methylase UbiE